jgi:hypothetical protein
VGAATDPSTTVAYGLICGGSYNQGMFESPIKSTQPDLVDIHIYPQIDGAQNTDPNIEAVAKLDFSDIPTFLEIAGLTSAQIVIGETYPGTLYPNEITVPGTGTFYCPGSASAVNPPSFPGYPLPSTTPNDSVAGFNSSSLSSYTVTFRPWLELQGSAGECYPYGEGPGYTGNYQTAIMPATVRTFRLLNEGGWQPMCLSKSLVFSALLPLPLAIAQSSGSISGVVMNGQGVAIAGAAVTASAAGVPFQATAGQNQAFTFTVTGAAVNGQ